MKKLTRKRCIDLAFWMVLLLTITFVNYSNNQIQKYEAQIEVAILETQARGQYFVFTNCVVASMYCPLAEYEGRVKRCLKEERWL